jgi:2-keto-3-deoxy-L-rhamnonate aldolase RhmA
MKSLLDVPRKGQQALGVYVSDAGVVVAEIAASIGFDYMRIDNEHTLNNPSTLIDLIRVAGAFDVPTLVRVASTEEVTKILDCGATGIMIPGVETVEQAMEGINLCKYAPLGERGMARASRAMGYGLADAGEYFATANEKIAFCVQIESKKGVDNIDAIAALEGVDIVTVGPWDLSQSLGVTGKTDHPDVVAAQDHVIQTVLKHKKVMLLSAQTPEAAAKLKDKGVLMATVCIDVPFIARSMKAHLDKFKA